MLQFHAHTRALISFYHNGTLPTGGNYRRSISIDYMYYNPYGAIQKIIQTKDSVLQIASEAARKTKKKINAK